MMEQVLRLTIDGQEVQCLAGSTVYEAAMAAGIHIPTFCHHDKLVPVGACRMCLVEIVGVHGLQTACTMPAREGMEVKVHSSPAAVKARWANIEFLLTNHPLDCPVCDKGGECPLQDQAMLDGPGKSRYVEEKRHKPKRYPLGELIVLDQERCVLCWRCIRFLDEWAGDHQLDLFRRGAETRLDTFPGRPLTSKWQGNTIDVCPVGALTSRVFRFEARVWELTDVPSICPLCSVGCNVVLGVKNNQLRRIVPRENMQVNDAWICDKGRFAHGFVDHPDRLTVPLIRRNGELRPAAWKEALRLVAQRFGEIKSEGPGAIAALGSTRVTNEANYLFQRFMRTIVGSNNVDHMGRMPSGASALSSLPDLERRDVILLLGLDPSTEAPLVELWIKKALLRHGAQVLAANPHRIELTRGDVSPAAAMPWLGYRPGSEVALMNGLARAILDAGLPALPSRSGDESRTQRTHLANLSEFRTWLGEYGPVQVERMTGVPAGTLRQAGEILAKSQRPLILYGPGWVQGLDAEGRLDAVANLALLLGGVEAGFVADDNNTLGALETGVVPELLPGFQPVSDNSVRNRLASLWGSKLSPVPGLSFDDMMVAARAGSLAAMWIMGADPAHDCRVAGDALGRVPFLVVQDLFMTDTASLAEVVLPAANFAETDGSFVNLTGRWQAIRTAMRPPGQAWPDWLIITELARLMLDGKRQSSWDFGGPADVLAEMARVLPGYRGMDYTKMGQEGWQRPSPATATRRAFVRRGPGRGQGLEDQDPDYPLILVTGRILYDRGTLLRRSDRIQRLVPDAFVEIHPADAEKVGLVDGDDVSLVSAKGRLAFVVKISEDVARGTVFAPLNLSDAPLSVLFEHRWALPRVRITKSGVLRSGQ